MEEIRPFVKWAGGKGSLISQLENFYPVELETGKIKTYIEPFVGGGAVLINILQKYNIEKAYAFDINMDLINCYKVIKKDVENLIVLLEEKEKKFLKFNDEERQSFFYQIRDEYNSYKIDRNQVNVKRAAEFIFLNRTCFNGLYRVNKDGNFNVPYGRYKNPTICDFKNLRKLSKLIENVEFKCGDYRESKKFVNSNTFVYFDPPYRPISTTSGFTSYAKEDFDDNAQKELAKYFSFLNDKNVKLMLSNSNPKNTNVNDDFFEKLYDGFEINEVFAKRMISADASKRGKISELLITNYKEMDECTLATSTMKMVALN